MDIAKIAVILVFGATAACAPGQQSAPPATTPFYTPMGPFRDLCEGVTYSSDRLSQSLVAADMAGRGGRGGWLDWEYDPNQNAHQVEFDIALYLGGDDPKDGCPYEVLLLRGTALAYRVKRVTGTVYAVQPMILLEPMAEFLDVLYEDDSVIIHYRAFGGGEIWEAIPLWDLPVG